MKHLRLFELFNYVLPNDGYDGWTDKEIFNMCEWLNRKAPNHLLNQNRDMYF